MNAHFIHIWSTPFTTRIGSAVFARLIPHSVCTLHCVPHYPQSCPYPGNMDRYLAHGCPSTQKGMSRSSQPVSTVGLRVRYQRTDKQTDRPTDRTGTELDRGRNRQLRYTARRGLIKSEVGLGVQTLLERARKALDVKDTSIRRKMDGRVEVIDDVNLLFTVMHRLSMLDPGPILLPFLRIRIEEYSPQS